MGLLDKLFPRPKKEIDGYFDTLTAYTPRFTSYQGGIYEMELTRAAIHAFANNCSKLKPEIKGDAYKNLEKKLQFKPNPWMDTSKFIYRVATILSVNSTAFIIPMYGDDMETVVGLYPLLPHQTEIVKVKEEPWLRYTFGNGQRAAIEFDRVGVMTTHQYKDDFFGDGNDPLKATMNLLDIQRQGMEEGIKQSAMIRFMAKIGQTLRPEDLEKEKKEFSKQNLSGDNKTGVMMFDAKYSDVKQIDSKPFVIDSDQMKLIQTNVYNYFGVNEKILQNDYDEDQWNAFYEGKIEPFALQLSLVISNMLYTSRELAHGNQVYFSSNRLQYASNRTKLQVSTHLFDRGILTTNQIMDIWNLPYVEDGDKRYIRKEYTEIDKLGKEEEEDATEAKPEGIPGTSLPDS